jgi:acetate---CoA ligase (ADP-forming) subunit beta
VVRTLAEHESLALLREHGIPTVDEVVARDAAAAVAAADRLGYPVVVKATGSGLAHKTERGLVRLGLRGPTDVEAAAAELLAAATDGPGELVVAPMVTGRRELFAGAHDDPQFGPTVVVGIGGVFAEALSDVAVGLAPIDDVDAREMIGALRAVGYLGAFRGEPAVDRDRLAAVLLALSDLITSRGEVVAVDVNPLVVVDGLPIAVDALVELRA